MKQFYVNIFLIFACLFQVSGTEKDKTVLLTILTKNRGPFLSKYLENIENLDYDKKLITIYALPDTHDPEANKTLEKWLTKHKNHYRHIILDSIDELSSSWNMMRNKSLQAAKTQNTDYYFCADCDTFLAPYTLKELIKKDKPIVAPLLHAIPDVGDISSNFFRSIMGAGYYKDHPEYLSILNRTKKGTIRVPLVFKAYLINTKYLDKLSYGYNPNEYEFIVFSRNARKNGVDQYICNEREFGVFAKINGSQEEVVKKFQALSPYINVYQQYAKKIIYLKAQHGSNLFTANNELLFALQVAGYELHQIDSLNGLRDYERLIVFENLPNQVPRQYPREKSILFLWEPFIKIPQNYNSASDFQYFSKIFTWRDDLVDNQKYLKLFNPALHPMISSTTDFELKKFAVLMDANEQSSHPKELYSERRALVDFYEKNHNKEFDLYGSGWPNSLTTYKGSVEDSLKVDTLKSYKFCYVYEDMKDQPGFITEKIFNCFQAGSVPIYFGAPNVTKYIPKECFIAQDDFDNHEELYLHLKNLGKEQYLQYIKNIQNYLASDQAKVFSNEHFVKTFLDLVRAPIDQETSEPPLTPTKTYAFKKEPIDVVIPAIHKDMETLDLCIQGIKDNCKQIRRVIVVSPEQLTDKAEWYDEKKFPFDKKSVGLYLFNHDEAVAQHSNVGWYYQQLLKLYAPFVIPNISTNVLIVDADTIFLNPVEFLQPSGAGLYSTEDEYHKPYFVHGRRLIPGFKRLYPQYSGITNYMLFQKPVLEDLFNVIERHQEIEPWKAFCRAIDVSENNAGASEYELYFNFVFSRTKQVAIRPLKWTCTPKLNELQKFKDEGYHYITSHSWLRWMDSQGQPVEHEQW